MVVEHSAVWVSDIYVTSRLLLFYIKLQLNVPVPSSLHVFLLVSSGKPRGGVSRSVPVTIY